MNEISFFFNYVEVLVTKDSDKEKGVGGSPLHFTVYTAEELILFL